MTERVREYLLDQKQAPLYDALCSYRKRRIVSFDVPGHKQGKGNPALTSFLGKDCLAVDVNSMKMLDNLIHPVGVIREAEELAADAFGAAKVFFMVNGTTAAVQAMIMATLLPDDKIILPRNVHRSVLNALILARAMPVYVNPSLNRDLGIPLGMSVADVAAAIKQHPDAKAVLVNNPTYYGVTANLKAIVELAHAAGMRVLVDEAHGTHFYFGEGFPLAAMAAGADCAAVSLHKTGGSLTQSSLLLIGKSMLAEAGYVHQMINLTQTTSASYLLLSSLDITRRELAQNGRELFRRVFAQAEYARREINALKGYYAFGAEICDGDACFAFDLAKLTVNTRRLGLSGIEVYARLRDDYGIQVEFGDIGNFLAIISLGDRAAAIERLLAALADILPDALPEQSAEMVGEYIAPEVAMKPCDAFYADFERVALPSSEGRIATESVMCYPPGIPILAPGERVTAAVLEYIAYAKAAGSQMTGTEDPEVEVLCVVK